MKRRKQSKKAASRLRRNRLLKYLTVLLIGGMVVAWGVKTGDNEEAQGSTYPGRESGSWISSLPLEVADGPKSSKYMPPWPVARNNSRKDVCDVYRGDPPESRARRPSLEYQEYQVSFPAVFLEKLGKSSSEAARVDVLLGTSKYLQRMLEIGDDFALSRFMEKPREWHRLAVPTGVARVIPGASLYLVSGCEEQHYLFAQKDDALYFLPEELNLLLQACGMKFDNSSVTKWAEVLTFLLVGDREFGISVFPEEDFCYLPGDFIEHHYAILRGERPFFPAFEIESLAVDTVKESHPEEWKWAPVGFVQEARVRFRVRSYRGEFIFMVYAGEDKKGPFVIPTTLWGDAPAGRGLIMPTSAIYEEQPGN